MRCAFIDLECRVFDEFGRQQCRVSNRYNLVVVAVKDEGWHINLLEIFRKIGFGECFDTIVNPLQACLHSLTPKRVSQALRDGGTRPISAKERRADILEELRTVGVEAAPDAIEHLQRQT